MSQPEAHSYPQTFKEGIVPQFSDVSPACLAATEQLLLAIAPLCQPIQLSDANQPFPFIVRGEVSRNLLLPSTSGSTITRYVRTFFRSLEASASDLLETTVYAALDVLAKGMDFDLRFNLGDRNPNEITQVLTEIAEHCSSRSLVIKTEIRCLPSQSETTIRPRTQWLVTIQDTVVPSQPLTLDLGELPRSSEEVASDRRLGFRATQKSFKTIAGLVPDNNTLSISYPTFSLTNPRSGDCLLSLSTLSAATLLKIVNSWVLHDRKEALTFHFLDTWHLAIWLMCHQKVVYSRHNLPEFIKQSMLFMMLEPEGFITELGSFDGLFQHTKLSWYTDLDPESAGLLAQRFRSRHLEVKHPPAFTTIERMYIFLRTNTRLNKNLTLIQFLNLLEPWETYIQKPDQKVPPGTLIF